MLKGNLLVGENQSVVLHAKSLQDLLKLAGTHCQAEPVSGQASTNTLNKTAGVKLRIDLSHSGQPLEDLLSGREDSSSNSIVVQRT